MRTPTKAGGAALKAAAVTALTLTAIPFPALAMGGPGLPGPTTVPVEYCADRDGDGYYDPAECTFFYVEGEGQAELYDIARYVVFRRKNLNLVDNCPQDWNSNQLDTDHDGSGDICEYVNVTAGKNHSCAMRADGSVHCWGDNSFGQATAPTWKFTHIAAGDNHTCGLLASSVESAKGQVLCWGDNSQNQLGATNGKFHTLRASGNVTCAIDADYNAKCWGACGSNQDCTPPERVVDVGPMFDAAGDASTRQDGLCFASGVAGRVGALQCFDGLPLPPAGGYFAVEGDRQHACGLAFGGAINCWGEDPIDPVLQAPPGKFSFISVGAAHACAIGFDRLIKCWGNNDAGQATPPAGKYEAIAVGDQHSCAVAQSGRIDCWGAHGVPANQDTSPEGILFGAVQGSLANKLLPRLTTYDSLSAEGAVSCGLTSRGGLHCSSLARAPFFAPAGKFLDVRVGEGSICATRSNGNALCWDQAGTIEEFTGVEKLTSRLYGEVTNAGVVDRQYQCGLFKSSKKMFCRDHGAPMPSEGGFQFGPKFIDVGVMGQRTACGITEDKRWLCQDYRGGSEIEPKPGFQFDELSCAGGTCCAKSQFSLFCYDATGALTTASLAGKRSLSVASTHACALPESAGPAYCVARSGDTSGAATPPNVALYELSAGTRFSCGLDNRDTTATCWGQVKEATIGAKRDFRGNPIIGSPRNASNTVGLSRAQ